MEWISNYINYKVWDEITYVFPNFNGARWILGVERIISSHILIRLVKGATDVNYTDCALCLKYEVVHMTGLCFKVIDQCFVSSDIYAYLLSRPGIPEITLWFCADSYAVSATATAVADRRH